MPLFLKKQVIASSHPRRCPRRLYPPYVLEDDLIGNSNPKQDGVRSSALIFLLESEASRSILGRVQEEYNYIEAETKKTCLSLASCRPASTSGCSSTCCPCCSAAPLRGRSAGAAELVGVESAILLNSRELATYSYYVLYISKVVRATGCLHGRARLLVARSLRSNAAKI